MNMCLWIFVIPAIELGRPLPLRAVASARGLSILAMAPTATTLRLGTTTSALSAPANNSAYWRMMAPNKK